MPNFVYTTGIPAATHNPSDDQGPMLANNDSISNIIAQEHYGFNDNNGGLHQQSTYPASAIAPPNVDRQGVLYTKQTGAGNQLYYIRDGLPSETVMTSAKIQKPLEIQNGVTFLPGDASFVGVNGGGILFQWGFSLINKKGTPTPISFPTPFSNSVFSITIGCITNEDPSTVGENNYFIQEGTVSISGFSIISSSSSAAKSLYWMAIGN